MLLSECGLSGIRDFVDRVLATERDPQSHTKYHDLLSGVQLFPRHCATTQKFA